jgi:O-antigen/teichoic acid export membrane protein
MLALRHILFNLLGLGTPLIIAVFTIPTLLAGLGQAQFGLLTIIWALVGYFGLFDLGLSRSMTRQIAIAQALNHTTEVRPIATTGIVAMGALGIVAGVVLAALANNGVAAIADIPDRDAAVRAIYWMAAGMPVLLLTSGYRGIMEARGHFGAINIIRVAMGAFTFLGPLGVLMVSPNPGIDVITAVLVASRVAAAVAHSYFAYRSIPDSSGPNRFELQLLGSLVRDGVWMTISNVVSPIMSIADRLMIGASISAAQVSYYATPMEIITKLSIVSSAVTAVVYPRFAAEYSHPDFKSTPVYGQSTLALYLLLLPVTTFTALFAQEIITIWIDAGFAAHSAPLLQLFSVGMFATCVAQIPFSFLQGAGHSRTTALIHLAELPLFLFALAWITPVYGVYGAALVWTGRVMVDAILMFWFCAPLVKSHIITSKNALCAAFAVLAFAGIVFSDMHVRVLWWLGICVVIALLAAPPLRRFWLFAKDAMRR